MHGCRLATESLSVGRMPGSFRRWGASAVSLKVLQSCSLPSTVFFDPPLPLPGGEPVYLSPSPLGEGFGERHFPQSFRFSFFKRPTPAPPGRGSSGTLSPEHNAHAACLIFFQHLFDNNKHYNLLISNILI